MTDFGTPPPPHEPPPLDDGTTAAAQQELLAAVPENDEDVLRSIAQALEHEAVMRTVANKSANALKAATKRVKGAYEHAAAYYARTRQVEMVFTTGGTIPEDDD
jgi:hypothetical protein